MKVKSLLTLGLLAASLTASASYPIYFRDTVTAAADGGGNMSFPCEEGQEAEYAVSNGTPKFAEDGSITLTRDIDRGGCYFRTKKLTEPCDKKYVVFAMDYKCNRPVNDLNIFHHEGINIVDQFAGALFTVSDNYQTVYVVLNREGSPWGSEDTYPSNYFWVSWNDANAHAAGFQFTVKNIRLMTIAEAEEECKAATGDYMDAFKRPNTSLLSDYDDSLDATLYTLNPEGDGNGLLQTGNLIRPLPNGCTTFAFDYIMVGEPFSPNVIFHKAADYTQMTLIGAPTTLEVVDDATPESWKTATFDLAEAVKTHDFAQTFGSSHFMWLQFKGMNPENLLWVKNPRWINPNSTSIDEIGVAERPADNRTFNLMGVEVKGELAPGLYIRNGKKFIVK